MTDEELDRLAAMIADALLASRAQPRGKRRDAGTWLPLPVRPEPPVRGGGEPPVWAGSAQLLSDVAPGQGGSLPARRVSTGELASATRAAAAGRGPTPVTTGVRGRVGHTNRLRVRGAPAIDVRVGVSRRHIHLSADHTRVLFGGAPLSSLRPLSQPGQFAANETVAVVGRKATIDRVRVVGPPRAGTQLELSASDAERLGVTPPLAASGSLAGSGGGVTLVGPAGRVELSRGVIVAARHLHLAPADAARWGLSDGDVLDVRAGAGARAISFHDVLVRSGPGHATELHLDVDEAHAAGVTNGATAKVIAWRAGGARRRPLVTERDVIDLARRGEPLPSDAILTPSARDRARALGIDVG